ncbi:MAG TPA: class II SORL domain-containing protein [Deltaproteobacteria bacterium]|nr:class II SORL domain-containing protein [Deltaproteobacteria bacterium]HPR52261.1 class II SORL domain-containing protein [Deltaproteobacteria bacterium]
MSRYGDLFQVSDFKTEKHVPLIECQDSIAANTIFEVNVSVGKEVTHPNTTEHHIRWIRVYFLPDGEKAAYELANVEFTSHGESVAGPNMGPAYTHHAASIKIMLKKSGTLYAASFCNIHGLWENSRRIEVK